MVTPLRPSPGGPLTFTVSCGGAAHGVTLEVDWTLRTPHDLDAERVLTAFGGTSACVHLADQVVPAARRWLARQLRLELPVLRVSADGAPVDPVCPRCPSPRAEVRLDLPDQAEHARTVAHVAREQRCDAEQLRRVCAALSQAHGLHRRTGPSDAELEAVEACVAPAGQGLLLWQVGLRRERIQELHRRVSYPGLPLPAAFYLQLLNGQSGDAGLPWLRRAARVRRYSSFLLDWLVQARAAGATALPPDRQAWLELRLPGRTVRLLSEAGYAAPEVSALGAGARLSAGEAGRWLEAWVTAGCRPAPHQLLQLSAYGLGWNRVPSAAALTRLLAEVGAPDGARTDLALLLLASGSVPSAKAWLAAGVQDAETVARAVTEGWSPADVPADRRSA